jgi:hypothetical protein
MEDMLNLLSSSFPKLRTLFLGGNFISNVPSNRIDKKVFREKVILSLPNLKVLDGEIL